MSSHRRRRDHRGAAAVEMALVLPILVALVFGIIDFAAAFNAQIQLSQAAQSGARIAAIGAPTYNQGDVADRAVAASPNLFGADTDPSVSATLCSGDAVSQATVTVKVDYGLLVPFPGITNIHMSQTAVMPCAQ